MTYLSWVLGRTLEVVNIFGTMVVSVAIFLLLLLLSPMLLLISELHFFLSNIHHQSSKFVRTSYPLFLQYKQLNIMQVPQPTTFVPELFLNC